MTNDRMNKKLYEWNPISTGLAGRRNLYGKKAGIVKINNWTKRIQN
jgi:hypothetical protein